MKNMRYRTVSETAQLELGFSGAAGGIQGQTAGSRAAWWFQKMREVVDRAVEWTPAPPARPEQTWLPNTHRECSV